MESNRHGRRIVTLGLSLATASCIAKGELSSDTASGISMGEECGADSDLDYPTPEGVDYDPGSYAGRRFCNPFDHLGEDCALPEGKEVRAIADGVIKVYRAASGYGELVVVIEHDLGRHFSFRNGNGELVSTRYIISIYGHLRRSRERDGEELRWEEGDCVSGGEVIGYVNDDLHNGDGDVHLHLGVRLMSADEAAARDDAWFRGYDEDGLWRGDFAAASEVISGVLNSVRHRPDGGLIKVEGNPDIFRLENGEKCLVQDEIAWRRERLWTAGHPDGEWHRVAIVSDEEMACYPDGPEMAEGVRRRLIRCRDGDFLWQEDNGNRRRIPVEAGTREYGELVRSWGFEPGEIGEDEEACDGPESFDPLWLRDGTLVREDDRSDVYFVTAHGVARPIVSWDLYMAMGYQADDIQWVPAGTLRDMVREIQRDRLLDWSEARECGAEAGDEGGGGVCVPESESCNGEDDDCDGEVDEDFPLDWDTGNCGECGNSCVRPNADFACVEGECVYDGCDLGWVNLDGDWENGCEYECAPDGGEVCDGRDNDCDGEVDEGIVCAAGADEEDDGLHEIRIRFCPGEEGTLDTDLPDLAGWYSHEIEDGCVEVVWDDVSDGTYRMNATYPGPAWECNEWPAGVIWLRNGEVPGAWVDGVEVEVTYGHEPRLEVGCNFFLEVG